MGFPAIMVPMMRMVPRFLSLFFVALGLLALPAHAAHPSLLPAYLHRPDPSFELSQVDEVGIAGTTCLGLRLTSQTWRTVTWQHELFLVLPASPPPAPHALLYITGGTKNDLSDSRLKADLREYCRQGKMVTDLTGQPVAILRQVPFQPLFGGLTEDDLLSHTFEQFMASGEEDWPILLPMVKAVVRAMDAVQQVAAGHGVPIATFTLTGASKRGWTTWLAGALDPRVSAIAPIAFDMLNFPKQLPHQVEFWGDYSEMIAAYTEKGLPQVVGTPRGDLLVSTVDPFSYLEHLTLPKLAIVGSNDPYWPVDASQLYFGKLPPPRALLIVPNRGHGAEDYSRLLPAVAFMTLVGAGRAELPAVDYHYEQEEGKLSISAWSDPAPRAARLWQATSAVRDFRKAEFHSQELKLSSLPEGKGIKAEVSLPEDGYTALFVEFEYRLGGLTLYLSTPPIALPQD